MRPGPACSVGFGGRVKQEHRVLFIQNRKVGSCRKKASTETTHLGMPWYNRPGRAGEQAEVLGGEVRGVTTLRPQRRADR